MSIEIDGIVTGDDVDIPVTLTKGKAKAVFAINAGATVKASLVSKDRATILIPAVVCNVNATGADWANSLVIVPFTSAETGALAVLGPVLLEIQVDDGGKLTWFDELEIIKGTIS